MALKGGSRFPVAMADVFPYGCHLVPNSIGEAEDYDEKTKTRRPAIDKVTGSRVWQCRVSDNDPDLGARSHEVVVKLLVDREPTPPTGVLFEPVEFDRLMVTPYVTDKGRLAFSLRAMGIKAARPAGQPGKEAA